MAWTRLGCSRPFFHLADRAGRHLGDRRQPVDRQALLQAQGAQAPADVLDIVFGLGPARARRRRCGPGPAGLSANMGSSPHPPVCNLSVEEGGVLHRRLGRELPAAAGAQEGAQQDMRSAAVGCAAGAVTARPLAHQRPLLPAGRRRAEIVAAATAMQVCAAQVQDAGRPNAIRAAHSAASAYSRSLYMDWRRASVAAASTAPPPSARTTP